jgi:hypothetical protein
MRGCLAATVFVMLGSMMLPPASAQRSAAKITGRVVDESGAPFPGVTITTTAGGQQKTIGSGADGAFALVDLEAGTYTVTAALPGFRTERRRIEVSPGETSVVEFALRVGCVDETVTVTDHPPLVDPRILARSDFVALLHIDARIDDVSPSDPDCRDRYRATLLKAVGRPSYRGPFGGTIDVVLTTYPKIEIGKEYIIWLTWRSDKNAFDSGAHFQTLVTPVEMGRVNPHRGPCIDISNPPPNYCPETYSVDELFAIFERVF